MTKILITGSNGLLGQKLIYALRSRNDITLIATAKGINRTKEKSGYAYEELDITNSEMVMNVLMKHKPDCVINTAAMTNVDACEQNKEECRRLNIDAVTYLTDACKKINAHFIHLSTDFVFDGTQGPYDELAEPNPLSYYAQTKYDGEKILMQSDIAWSILRTIIIYGTVDDGQRSNVVLWTKKSLEQHQKINVITDQYRCPTLAEDLADACIQCALKKAEGIFHVSGKDFMSIWQAAEITADFFHLDKSLMQPVTTAQLNQPAKRPLVTGFVIDKAKHILNYNPHSFTEGLEIVAGQLNKTEQ